MTPPEILRYAAFSADPDGGNPAGVVLDASALTPAEMQAIAADVGYSETAFIVAASGGRLAVRYYSPQAEVTFCGHATIAAGVAWADHQGPADLQLDTLAGEVGLSVTVGAGRPTATLVSVRPSSRPCTPDDLHEALAALGWRADELDPAIPPRIAYAGAHHLVLAAATRSRLADLKYDFDRLGALMTARDLTTVQLVWRESADTFHARNPFPPGGVVEDPATGAAAAALGGYLREIGAIDLPASLTIHQGDDMGRPGIISVGVPAAIESGISVSGTAVEIAPPAG